MGNALNKHRSKPLLYIQQPEFPEVSIIQQEKISIPVDHSKEQLESDGKGRRKKQKRLPVVDILVIEDKESTEGKITPSEQNAEPSRGKTGRREWVQKGDKNPIAGKSIEHISIDEKDEAKAKEKDSNIKEVIRRLALYPPVLERPICEATIRGERKRFQVLSKRGNFVRIKVDNSIEMYNYKEFYDFQIINPTNNNEDSK
ncbi:hypothetical protein [Fervidibacillus halotolerans]|uniref:Spore coat protein CotO n=1 Tax=Fervidibacillus halotolerans TaxID=2980027 RepID=A0A9E8RXT4_9BACI|nr:hypothetical protein [Fervidibacillus halotolerans]WAA13080.1 hypothetical protein OE105_02835 [Fervidibacillus halotolerans]